MTIPPVSNAELEALIARTSLKYDLLPYTSNPFPLTHPGRLCSIARLFGLEAAPVETARVLELGCAAGGNIIPHGVRFPESRLVGVDLSRTQVAAGRARLAHLGLGNVELHCKSFTELDATSGPFDYVICHGVYSWVPAPVRDAILRICREMLAPTGVAVVSYNVLPGWRMLQALRDCFLLHGAGAGAGHGQVARARSLLEFLRTASPETGAYKQIMTTWGARLADLPDDYIGHEFLEEVNEPCTFQEFVASAARHGLGYLADSDLPSTILDNQPPETARKLIELGQNQQIAAEQYLDMLTGRTFRQSLLVKSERIGELNRNLAPERIDREHVLIGSDLKLERNAAGGGHVADGAGRRLTASLPVIMDALEALIARYPASQSVDELAAALPADARGPANRTIVREALYKMVLAGLATMLSAPVPAASSVQARPVAWRLARLDAARGESATTNLRHERIGLDSLAQTLLPLLDGSRDLPQLTGAVLAAVGAGRLSFSRDGAPIRERSDLEGVVPAQVQGSLASMQRLALLEQ